MQFKKRRKTGGEADAKVRVLFFDHTAVLSGGELALLSLVGQLDRSKYEPIVVLGEDGPLVEMMQLIAETHIIGLDPKVKDVRKDVIGWRTLINPTKLYYSGSYVFRLAHSFKSLGADVVHTNSLKADILGGIASKMARIPLIWHVRDRIEKEYLPSKVVTVFRGLCRILPDRVIANSQATMKTLHLEREEEIYVISSGFDAERFRRAGEGRVSLSAAVNSGEALRIGIVGRISPWKGQDIFLRAAQQIHREFPATHFYVIGAAMFGESEYEDSLHVIVREGAMEGYVTFSGFQRDIAKAIGELDILVHASIVPEPLGQVIAQGMAANKPVVATRGGGASEIVSHGVTGILITPGDVDAMVSAVVGILRDPQSAERMAERAQSYALREFSETKVARAVEGVYESMFD